MLRGMYVPEHFRTDEAWAIVEANPFATLVALPSGDATHVPLTLEPGPVLMGHVARHSPLADAIVRGDELLAVFTGPHAYVSPFDYVPAGGSGYGRNVPTWNYLAAHVRGRPRVLEGDAVRSLLGRLAARFDRNGWTDAALPDDYRKGLERAIVAFELTPSEIVGKAKLGQNRTDTERLAAADALSQRTTEDERAIGERMKTSKR